MKTIISAPFGNYLQVPGCISTLGTYTLHYRGGLLRRVIRMLRTYRTFPGGCINKLGLPNPGIMHLVDKQHTARHGHRAWTHDKILSIHGFDQHEWEELLIAAYQLDPLAIELNISCPNVAGTNDFHTFDAIRQLHEFAMDMLPEGRPRVGFPYLIYKLPPFGYASIAATVMRTTQEVLERRGVTIDRPVGFHCCNTLPTPYGGISGKPLKPLSLAAVQEIRNRWPSACCIGGGGITGPDDVDDYRAAGADAIAVGSHLMNPLRAKSRMLAIRNYTNETS